MKVLYLFSGSRKHLIGKPGRDFPDTQLYGLDFLKTYGIEAESREFSDLYESSLLGGSFRIRHGMMYFLTRGYDVVFGSSLLYTAFFKKILPSRSKFALLNTSLNRLLSANENNPLKFRFIKSLLWEISAVVCLSSVQKRYLDEKYPFLRAKTHFIPLGVDIAYHQAVYDGRQDYILSVGSDNGRDYATVIETAKRLPRQSFQIVCSKRNLEGVGALPANVSVDYYLPIAQVREKYRQAKLLLLTTHKDNYADGSDCSGQTVLLDAMASGLPVIASRKEYLQDYAEDGKDVALIDAYNPQRAADKIVVLEDPGLRRKLAESARKKVEKHFSTNIMAKSLAELFISIAGK